jgi:hypothetical protein
MQDAGIKWLAAAAVVAVTVTACGGGGDTPRAAHVRTDAEPASVRRAATSSTSPITAPVAPAPLVSTTTTSVALPHPSAAPPPPPPVVSVSVAALQGGAITRSDGAACSNISSQTLAKGLLEVRRTGSTAAPLTVRYSTTGGAGDFTPLPDSVTIVPGASTATVEITPTMAFGPGPQHVHRSSSLAFAVLDDPAYDLGAPATAAVTLNFDVDVSGCDPPTS